MEMSSLNIGRELPTQSIQSARLSVQSSELVPPTSLGPRGETHSLAGKVGEGILFRRRDRYFASIFQIYNDDIAMYSPRLLPSTEVCQARAVMDLHGLINYKDTNTKCRLYWCLIEFLDWRYSQSCWYFRPSFVNYCPSNLLSGSPPPLPVHVNADSLWL
jgi:hypothetical protein